MSIIFTPSSPYTTSSDPISNVLLSPFISDPLSNVLLSPDVIMSSIFPISNLPPMTVNLEFSKPLISFYETIDDNLSVREKMVKYYFDIIRDKWLLDELNDILNYFTYKDGKVSMIKKLSDYDPKNISKDTDKIAEEKVKYIEKHVLDKYDLTKLLAKFTKETGSKWVNLPKNEFFLRIAVKEYLMKEIKKKLKGQDGGSGYGTLLKRCN